MFLSNPLPLMVMCGGKRFKLLPNSIDLMMPHKWYMEVFAGMKLLFFYISSRIPDKEAIINDINSNIVNCLEVVREKTR